MSRLVGSVGRRLVGGLVVVGLASGTISLATPAVTASASTSSSQSTAATVSAELEALQRLEREFGSLHAYLESLNGPLADLKLDDTPQVNGAVARFQPMLKQLTEDEEKALQEASKAKSDVAAATRPAKGG